LATLVLLNNFLHDFSAAGWLFGSVILWSLLRKEIKTDHTERTTVDVLKTVLLLMRLSVAGIVLFGVIRTMAYKTYEWSAAAGQGQVTLLIVKHLLFLGVFVLGLVYYIRASKFVKKLSYEKSK
jgi:uncharacterized membrane protein